MAATNVLIDSTGTMYFGEERETWRNCPRCLAFSRMSPQAVPTFDELLLQKPRSIGVVLRCHACNTPVFLRYATRAFVNNRVELAPQAFDVERPVEKFAFNYVPEDVETFFREALVCYSHNQYQAFAAMCRRSAAVTFADLGNSTKLRLFDSITDVRETEILGDGQVVDQMVLLKDETDVLLVQRHTLLVAHRVNRVAEEEELARPRAVEHAENREERRLAGARRAHDRDELARLNLPRDPAQHVRSPRGRLEHLLDVPHRDQRPDDRRGRRVAADGCWFGEECHGNS